MSKRVQHLRGTTSLHATFTGRSGEITVDTDKKTAVVHDGATAGGFALARSDVLAATGGASLIGIADVGGYFASLQVEAALQEMASATGQFATEVNVLRYIPPALWPAIVAGTSTTELTTYAQTAVDFLTGIGGGVLFFPAGLFLLGNVKARNKVKVRGVRGGTVLKVPAGVDKQVFYNENQAAGTPIDYFGLEDLILDGNVSNAPRAVAASAVAVNCVNRFYARNCIFQNSSGYGLAFQSQDNTSLPGQQKRIYLEGCEFNDNGIGSTTPGDTYDGLDIKDCERLVAIDCHANRNYDRGFNIRGQFVSMFGCTSEGNGFGGTTGLTGGFEMVANVNTTRMTTLRMVSCESYNNSGPGFNFSNGTGTPAANGWVRVQMSACTARGNGGNGLETLGTSNKVEMIVDGLISVENAGYGVDLAQTTLSCKISGTIKGNGLSGVRTAMTKLRLSDCDIQGNTGYGVEETATATRTILDGATIVTNNTAGQFLWNANGRRHVGRCVVDYDAGVDDAIASAATITLPEGGDFFAITGTTSITSITAGRRGRVVTLQFAGALTVTDGSNLALAGNFVTTSADTITLACDGTNWFEISRSVN